MSIVVLLWLITCIIASLIILVSSIIGGDKFGYRTPIQEPLLSIHKSAISYITIPIINIWKAIILFHEVSKY